MMETEFAIGVAGHRLEKLQNADISQLQQRITEVLNAVASTATQIVVVTSLAEGSDRMVAEIALDLGYASVAVLPFRITEFEGDFPTDSSKRDFRNLVDRTETVIELAGDHSDRASRRNAYAAAAATVANLTNQFLAIWDGGTGFGPGSTANQIADAVDAGKPVIWIHSEQPHAVTLLDPADNAPDAWKTLVNANGVKTS